MQKFKRMFNATHRIAIESQIGEWEVKEYQRLHVLYRLCCDMISTQILNSSQRSDFAKIWNHPNNCGFGGVRFFDGVKLIRTDPVAFQPGPGTEPPIWNRCIHYHQGVPNGSVGSDGTLYPLMEHCTRPIAQAMDWVAYLPSWLCTWNIVTYTLHQNGTCVTLFVEGSVML
jgi:hypothetical protein